jgi:hypothetical protein
MSSRSSRSNVGSRNDDYIRMKDVKPNGPKAPLRENSESVIHINEHELDKECVRLPAQYHQAAWQAGETIRDIDEATATLKVREAEVFLAIRGSEPSKFGLEKYSEGSIKELAEIDPDLIQLKAKIRQLDHKLAMENVLVKALDFKRRSLTNLVELHSSGYHAQVRPSAPAKQALDQISRQRISKPLPWKQRKDETNED